MLHHASKEVEPFIMLFMRGILPYPSHNTASPCMCGVVVCIVQGNKYAQAYNSIALQLKILVLYHSCRLSEYFKPREAWGGTKEDKGSDVQYTAEEQGIQSMAQIRLPQKTKASIHIQYHSTTTQRRKIKTGVSNTAVIKRVQAKGLQTRQRQRREETSQFPNQETLLC